MLSKIMREKLSCYIIDDEHLAQRILQEYVAKVSFLEWKGSFSSALEASARMDQDKPDLLFLDINMPDINGISFISMMNIKPMIILTGNLVQSGSVRLRISQSP